MYFLNDRADIENKIINIVGKFMTFGEWKINYFNENNRTVKK